MELLGSCHCGAVMFSLISHTTRPYMRCYCSICRKNDGGGGFAINIMGMTDTLKVEGKEHVRTYSAMLPSAEAGGELHPSSNVRSFCGKCGTHVWAHDERWAQWIYPLASAIDTDLPAPPHTVHMMLGSKARWVEPQIGKDDTMFEEYPELSIEDWHKKHGCYVE